MEVELSGVCTVSVHDSQQRERRDVARHGHPGARRLVGRAESQRVARCCNSSGCVAAAVVSVSPCMLCVQTLQEIQKSTSKIGLMLATVDDALAMPSPPDLGVQFIWVRTRTRTHKRRSAHGRTIRFYARRSPALCAKAVAPLNACIAAQASCELHQLEVRLRESDSETERRCAPGFACFASAPHAIARAGRRSSRRCIALDWRWPQLGSR